MFNNVYVPNNSNFCVEGTWNGCGPSVLPDFLTDPASEVTNFRDACNAHDICYDDCAIPREQCETNFKNDMYEECNGDFLCEFLADLYHGAVNTLGESVCTDVREAIGCSAADVAKCS